MLASSTSATPPTPGSHSTSSDAAGKENGLSAGRGAYSIARAQYIDLSYERVVQIKDRRGKYRRLYFES